MAEKLSVSQENSKKSDNFSIQSIASNSKMMYKALIFLCLAFLAFGASTGSSERLPVLQQLLKVMDCPAGSIECDGWCCPPGSTDSDCTNVEGTNDCTEGDYEEIGLPLYNTYNTVD